MLATTRLSTKGQVVIPEEIRRNLHLNEGVQFIVLGDKDVVILKKITPPSMAEFDSLIQKSRTQALKAGMRNTDIENAIKAVRGRKK